MKNWLCALFILGSVQAYGLDCLQTDWSWRPQVSKISPAKARQFLKTNDLKTAPELEAFKNRPLLNTALEYGFYIFKDGNEAMIYSVDALLVIAEGAEANKKSLPYQLNASFHRFQNLVNEKRIHDYFEKFQLVRSYRVVGTLILMKRFEEAQILIAHVDRTLDMAEHGANIDDQVEQIYLIRMVSGNTGYIASASKSQRLCERIQALAD